MAGCFLPNAEAHRFFRSGALLLSIVAGLSLLGCQPLDQVRPETASPVEGSTYVGGVSILFEDRYQQERRQDATPKAGTFDPYSQIMRMDPGSPLVTRVGLIWSYPDAKNVRLMLLANYRQIAFSLEPLTPVADDHPLPSSQTPPLPRDLHGSATVFLEPAVEVNYILTAASLPAGYYDLALVVVLDPDKTQGELRYSTAFTPIARAGLFVGDSSPSMPALAPLDSNPRENSRLGDLCLLTPNPTSSQNWPGQTVKPGDEVNLFLRLQPFIGAKRPGSPASEPIPVALVGFLEDEAVEINGKPVIFGTVRTGELSTIPLSFTAPREPGTYQFFVHRFPNVFTDPVVDNPGDRSFSERACQRIVLEVRE